MTAPEADRAMFDLAIVGAGPVGVTLAALLAQLGVTCFVGDRSETVYPLPRAAHFDHEIMRVFQQLGVADLIASSVTPARRYVFQNAAGKVLMDFDLREPAPTGWHGYMIHQPGIEEALRASLTENRRVTLRTGVGFVGQAPLDDGVESRWSDASGDFVVRSRFLIGCDGAASPVRGSMAGRLEDLGFDEPWLVLDLEVEEENGLPAHNIQYCDPARPTTYCVMGNRRRRFEFMLRDDEVAEEMVRDEAVEGLLARHAIRGPFSVERRAVYRFHALIAERWRVGPTLLAGDAAHQMPPFAGQGMCSGIRDAAALAWRIGLVLRGATEELLDGYQLEREPHVRTITEAAIETGRVVCTLDPGIAAARDARMLAARASGLPPPDIRAPSLELSFGLPETPFAGTVFPQPVARTNLSIERLDDVLGPGAWLIVGGAADAPASDLPIRSVATAEPALAPFRGALEAWLDQAGRRAVLVRADRYVFGTGDPARLVEAFGIQAGLT